jgi:hypothetical protein
MSKKPFPFEVCKECCNTGSGGGENADLSDYYTKEETEKYVGEQIGEVETALDNIITKYGLGGESQ